MTAPSSACALIDGFDDLAGRYDVVLSDVWGVVHNGRAAYPEAVEALRRFRAGGGTVVLITNAPRPHGPVVRQLERLGVTGDTYDAIVTSGDATIALIETRGAAPLFHIGPAHDRALFEELRAITGVVPPFVGIEEAEHVVCTGLFDDAVETPDDYAPLLATMRSRGLDMICANPDIVVHIGEQLTYCGGAIAERFESMGGSVFYAGKPHSPIYEVALKAALEHRRRPVDMRRVLAIGDAIRTDVAGAAAQGLDCLFVAGGIHRDETLVPETGRVDPDAVGRLFAGFDRRPVAAIGQLVWRG